MIFPPVMFPNSENSRRMNFPNRLELLLYTVLALPKASRIGLHVRMNRERDREKDREMGGGEDRYMNNGCSIHIRSFRRNSEWFVYKHLLKRHYPYFTATTYR